ncbi:hypothetical protein QQ045_017796 [Rhodiola kirilowii]
MKQKSLRGLVTLAGKVRKKMTEEEDVLRLLMAALGFSCNWQCWNDLNVWRSHFSWSSREQKEVASFIINASIFESLWKNRNRKNFRRERTEAKDIIAFIWSTLKMRIELLRNKERKKKFYNLSLPRFV